MKPSRLALAMTSLMAVVGCTLTQSELRKGAELLPTIGTTGRLIVPRQCGIRTAIVTRPDNDEALGEALWSVADSQVIDDATRRVIEANGIRLGVITGDLPPAVQEVFDAPPPRQVTPATVILPDGESSLVRLEAHEDELNLLMALQANGSVGGKRYSDANGLVRLTGTQHGDDGVRVRVQPELHHGPVRQGWGVASGGGSLSPSQLVMHNGQAEETLRDLAATVTLRPGQVLVLSCEPNRKGSLGHFLFATTEANSDRPLHKVLFVWAKRVDRTGPVDLDAEPGRVPPTLEPVDPPADEPTSPAADATTSTRRHAGALIARCP